MKELKKDCAYALVVPTSMGVRISPSGGQPTYASDQFFMQATSAETNVASIASYLGLPVKVLTTFVKDSPVAQFIKRNLKSRNMAFEGAEVEQARGGTAISLTSRTAVMARGARVCRTTVRAR